MLLREIVKKEYGEGSVFLDQSEIKPGGQWPELIRSTR
jgi:hypothetical protein